eukprot:g26761.t1
MHVEANDFINLRLSWDKAENKRVVSPPHYVIMWHGREKSGKLRYTSSLLSLRLIEETDLPEQVEAAIEVRGTLSLSFWLSLVIWQSSRPWPLSQVLYA